MLHVRSVSRLYLPHGSKPLGASSLWTVPPRNFSLSAPCWISSRTPSFLSFRFQSPPHNQREELPLGAMAGITSDILGLDVLLWLMAGSSRWSWEQKGHAGGSGRHSDRFPLYSLTSRQNMTGTQGDRHRTGERELTLRKETT